MATQERPPQATLVVRQNGLQVSTRQAQITLAIRPVPPPAQPKNGTLDGNVYRFDIRAADGAPIKLKRGGEANVFLRGTGAPGSPTIEQYSGGRWVPYSTTYMGNSANVYRAQVTSFGYFALVVPRKAATPVSPMAKSGSILRLLVIALLIGVLAVVALLLVRLSRQRATE